MLIADACCFYYMYTDSHMQQSDICKKKKSTYRYITNLQYGNCKSLIFQCTGTKIPPFPKPTQKMNTNYCVCDMDYIAYRNQQCMVTI